MTAVPLDKGVTTVAPRRILAGLLRALLGSCPPQPPRLPRVPSYVWQRHSALLFDR